MSASRRRFLHALAAGGVGGALPAAIARALALPAANASGGLQDLRHIVILMQENRSFDQLFGTLRGVRGFADPRAVRLQNGRSVFEQPNGAGVLAPYRSALPEAGLQYLADVDHGWASSHAAWNGGHYDGWVASKGAAAMQCYARSELPFHYALADAFTICDAYHCSMMGPTDPNRYYLWSGGLGADGRDGGPAIDNSAKGYGWTTLPEVLTRSGVSWKIYQDRGTGLAEAGKWGSADDPYIGNYGDNALLYFNRFRDARPGDPLFEGARRGTAALDGEALLADFARDIIEDRLPQVSWLVAPEAYSEHPNWPVNFGAWYVARVLDSLTARPRVWGKTALLLCYDEAGGFFDHVVPPYPAAAARFGASTVDTSGEIFPGSDGVAPAPYGLGTRVPMIVISPWSRGGWVCSQVFDHTSIIRFIERRFGAEHPGLAGAVAISPWRRAICGDLTSAFDFTRADVRAPHLPSTAAYLPRDHDRHDDALETAPAALAPPPQEHGQRPARSLPYSLHAQGRVASAGQRFEIAFANHGDAGACFHVRSQAPAMQGPWSYTVGAGASLVGRWDLAIDAGVYDLHVHGPDGFYRAYRGGAAAPTAACTVELQYDADGVVLLMHNRGPGDCEVHVEDRYGAARAQYRIAAGAQWRQRYGARPGQGWYDLLVRTGADPVTSWHFAGRVPDTRPGVSDPALSGDSA